MTSTMTRDEYWALIERARTKARAAADDDDDELDPDEAVCEWLEAHLAELAPGAIVAFEEHTSALLAASYSWALWGAAYLINGGCSDDGFDYFRGWLLAQGRAVFEAALANPDSLADHVPGEGEVECEDFLSLAMSAYEAATDGEELPLVGIDLPELGEDDWDFDDGAQMQRRYPRLWARFGWED